MIFGSSHEQIKFCQKGTPSEIKNVLDPSMEEKLSILSFVILN